MPPTILVMFLSAAAVASSQYMANLIPDSVPLATRRKSDREQSWCQSQTSQCPLICLQIPGAKGSPTQNTCSADTLAYQCVCSNGLSPNASQYSLTMPYYICTETATQCVNKCSDSACQSACRNDHPCGAQKPKIANTTATSATPVISTSVANIQATKVPTAGASQSFPLGNGYILQSCVLIGGVIAGLAALP
ncbi:hypothetical protein N7468_005599 [Penicillium chermesinum]|uniref:DUF7707 domain-containing protein n=1 Tax=Penicillium chermesinum TaxID=63820 RepID=A0A9W9TNJ8_9EURO|nr:uncharacterized protein N7468_005599 [Penicillium chermesinum]KAJ5232643.1 hypothetical protein N7468_005599 [Penicillium chermesinum]KAJ6172303.1 hypothetical protein N7470_001370 [Penicillium chermesinum]